MSFAAGQDQVYIDILKGMRAAGVSVTLVTREHYFTGELEVKREAVVSWTTTNPSAVNL